MNKRHFALIAVGAALLTGGALSGCGNKDETPADSPATGTMGTTTPMASPSASGMMASPNASGAMASPMASGGGKMMASPMASPMAAPPGPK